MVTTREIFLLSAIVDKTGVAEDVARITSNSKGMNESQVGMQVIVAVLAKLYKAEKEVVQLVSNCTGKTTEEVMKMPFKELKESVTGILKEEGVMDFLSEQATDKDPKTLPTSSKGTKG